MATKPDMLTEVYLRADTRIDEQPVPIEATTIGKDFFLQLARPATLGTPVSFGYWLNETYQTKVNLLILDDLDDTKKITTSAELKKVKKDELLDRLKQHLAKQGIPDKVQNVLAKALLAKITIIDLLIDGRKTDGEAADGVAANDTSGLKLRFGLEVSFEDTNGLDILPNIALEKVTLIVSRFPKGYTFPPRAPIPQIEPPEEPKTEEPKQLPAAAYASGYIEFSANPGTDGKITLNGVDWTFVDDAATGTQTMKGKSLDETLEALAKDLNACPDGPISKCSYEADKANKRLTITFKDSAPAGEDFTIAADAKSKGKASKPKLSVGD